ncbi:MAG: hypothetical protein CBARDMAM_1803 [uncultured Caballeronia sp.]|nr:MAG: hypothetical protein CBARDMAM_1803 [uncultured Caballeronia sp.]
MRAKSAGRGAAQRLQRMLEPRVSGERQCVDVVWLELGWQVFTRNGGDHIRRASSVVGLYYPFSGNPSIVRSAAIPWSGPLVGNLDDLFNKDYQLAHSYNMPRRDASVTPGRQPR